MISSFDIQKLKELLNNFYTLTHLRIVVFDDQLQEIVGSTDHSDFCKIIRSHPGNRAKCNESDRTGCTWCKKNNQIHIYQCHAGLTEVVAPIRSKNLTIGYMMFGQAFHHEDKDAYWPVIRENCASYEDVDLVELKKAFYNKKHMSRQEIFAAAQILEACAGYLWLAGLTTLSEDSLPHHINDFISENLAGDLSVEEICRHFNISKSKLYKVSQHCYGTGIQGFIRNYRVDTAKGLLESTNQPINQIAVKVGIPNYNYFTKVFKSRVGVTPKDYRAQSLYQRLRVTQEA